MNEEQYKSVCDACDRVLLAPDSTIERVAIPYLHIVREHPAYLGKYADLFAPSTNLSTMVGHCLRLVRNCARWVREIGKALFSAGVPWFGPQQLPSDVDVLFVSHLLTEAQASKSDDFYFGDLPNKLAEQGLVVVIVLINHTGQSGESLVGRLNNSGMPRLVFSGSLGISEEFVLHRRLKAESKQLRGLAKMQSLLLMKRVLLRASQEVLSNSNLRIASQMSTLVDELNAKAVIVTHEGHAWERMVFAAARNSRPNVYCIGYQHAAIFRLQHAIRRKLAPIFRPDHILTAGVASKAQLDREPGLSEVDISILGSNRAFQIDPNRVGCQPNSSTLNLSRSMTCLVVPEGIASECLILFEFSLACARSLPQMRFVWRLHPLMAFDKLVSSNSKFQHLPPNIVLSTASLADDFDQCHWVLHRGSTVVIQAVVAGLKPIYLELNDEMTINPLYEVEHSGMKVETVEQFHSAIDTQNGGDWVYGDEESNNLKAYCEEFYLPLDYTVIPRIISLHVPST